MKTKLDCWQKENNILHQKELDRKEFLIFLSGHELGSNVGVEMHRRESNYSSNILPFIEVCESLSRYHRSFHSATNYLY